MIYHRNVNALINARAAIPDNNPRGVNSVYRCQMPGKIRTATLHVDIQHSAIGELTVNLISPTGVNVSVHNRVGGNRANLKETFANASLKALNGQESEGNWTLHVVDHLGRDTGTIHSWRLELDLERNAENANRFSVEVNKLIAAKDGTGVTAMVNVPKNATNDLKGGNLRFHFEMERQFITDLNITLTSPSGKKFALNKFMGWSKFGKKSWTLPGMRVEGLADELLHGNWSIAINGANTAEVGRLESFAVECVPMSKLADRVIGIRAKDFLIRSGINTQSRLDAAVPLEISSTLALRGHEEPVSVANRVLEDRKAA